MSTPFLSGYLAQQSQQAAEQQRKRSQESEKRMSEQPKQNTSPRVYQTERGLRRK